MKQLEISGVLVNGEGIEVAELTGGDLSHHWVRFDSITVNRVSRMR